MNTSRSEKKVTDCLNVLTADFCDKGIVKLVQRLDKCLNLKGYVVSNNGIKNILMNKILFYF
jgi:hypothetical protein